MNLAHLDLCPINPLSTKKYFSLKFCHLIGQNRCNFCTNEVCNNDITLCCSVVDEVDTVLQSKASVTGFDLKQLIYTTQV